MLRVNAITAPSIQSLVAFFSGFHIVHYSSLSLRQPACLTQAAACHVLVTACKTKSYILDETDLSDKSIELVGPTSRILYIFEEYSPQ
jgi:hypothetical protein